MWAVDEDCEKVHEKEEIEIVRADVEEKNSSRVLYVSGCLCPYWKYRAEEDYL